MDSIGNRLFELRKKKGLTQEQLSERLEVSRQSVSNWELDKSLPDTDRLLALATIYEVSLDYIAYGDLSKSQESDTNIDAEAMVNMVEQNKETSQDVKNIIRILSDSAIENVSRRSAGRFLIAAMIVITAFCIPVFVIFVGIMTHLTSGTRQLNSDLAVVDHVLEQYTYAEVHKMDAEGNYVKDRVWLDTRNVVEGDYIFAFSKPGHPRSMQFEYYFKTMFVPFLVLLVLLTIDVLLGITLRGIYGKIPENKGMQV